MIVAIGEACFRNVILFMFVIFINNVKVFLLFSCDWVIIICFVNKKNFLTLLIEVFFECEHTKFDRIQIRIRLDFFFKWFFQLIAFFLKFRYLRLDFFLIFLEVEVTQICSQLLWIFNRCVKVFLIPSSLII